MKVRLLAVFVPLLLATSTWSMDPLKVDIVCLQCSILPGEQIITEVRITNISSSDVIFRGKVPKEGVGVEMRLFNHLGKAITCSDGPQEVVIGGAKDKCATSALGPSQIIIITESTPLGLAYCPLPSVPAGNYTLKVVVQKWDTQAKGNDLLLASKDIDLEIQPLVGEDETFLAELTDSLEHAEEKDLKRPRPSSKPLRWYEILSPIGFSGIFSRVCSAHPTSTYAAYAFAQAYGARAAQEPLDSIWARNYLVKLQKSGRETLTDRTRHLATGPDGKELKDAEGKPIPITTEEWLRKTVGQAEQVCAAHPGLLVTERIRYNIIGFDYLELLQFQNAAKVFEKLRDSAVDPQIKENSGNMLQLLKEAGLIAN